MARKRSQSNRAILMRARKELKDIAKELRNDNDIISQNYASQIEKYVKGTYGLKSDNDITSILQTVADVKSTTEFGSDSRKEKIFTRNIAQASVGGVSTVSKEEVKIFYGATQKAWEGLPIEKRNQAIKDYFGVETLEEAWEKVFETESAQNALKEARRNQEPISSDSDIQDGTNDEKEGKGSPPYMKGLVIDLDTNG